MPTTDMEGRGWEGLKDLEVASEVQALLESMLPEATGPPPHASRSHELLQAAFAHIPFFANLPGDLRDMCITEGVTVVRLGERRDLPTAANDPGLCVLHRQGARVDADASLCVIVDGTVAMHAHSPPKAASGHDLGPEVMLLRPGDAFGDEVLGQFGSLSFSPDTEHGGREVQYCRSAAVHDTAVCIQITHRRVLGAIADFLAKTSSMLYFLHPQLCFASLRKPAGSRSPLDVLRAAQCIDALCIFGQPLGQDTGHFVASSVDFADVLPGQSVFLEREPICPFEKHACFVVVHGQVALCRDGAGPDHAMPRNPCPHLGHIVDVLSRGDVILDPAPFYLGKWPCSAVALTSASVISIPAAAYQHLRNIGMGFAGGQFEKLLSKPPHCRTHFENQRIAQFLSAVRPMLCVPMDRRVPLAKLMSLLVLQPDQVLTLDAPRDMIVMSGRARVLDKRCGIPQESSPSGKASSNQGSISPEMALQILNAKPQTPLPSSDEKHQQEQYPNADVTSAVHTNWLEKFGAKGCSLLIVVAMTMGKDLIETLFEISDLEDAAAAKTARQDIIERIGPFLSSFEALWLSHSLMQHCQFATGDVVQAGDVIGSGTVFPSSKGRNLSNQFVVLERLAVLEMTHNDSAKQRTPQIFRRGNVSIPSHMKPQFCEALTLQPQQRSPEHIANARSGLQNIPPLSYLLELAPEAFEKVCEQMTLVHLEPGETMQNAGERVVQIYVVLQGLIEGHVCSPLQTFDDAFRFWHAHDHDLERTSWQRNQAHARKDECIAVYGPSDCVGFADLLGGLWFSSMRAGHQECTLACIPASLLHDHRSALVSKIMSTVSPASCIGVLQVPRAFSPQEDLMMLHMLLSKMPSFFGLSDEVVARLCTKAVHVNASPSQVICIQGEETDLYAMTTSGRVAAYRGRPGAVKTATVVQDLHSGGYMSLDPFRHSVPTVSLQLYRFAQNDTDLRENASEYNNEALWVPTDIDIDADGNMSYSTVNSKEKVGNITLGLTDLEAGDWLLTQCKLKLSTRDRGVDKSREDVPRAFGRAPSLSRKKSSAVSRTGTNVAVFSRTVSGASRQALHAATIGRRPSASKNAKIGNAIHRVKLTFADVPLTVWGSDPESLSEFLLCVMAHWFGRNGHPLGNLRNTYEEGSEFGGSVLYIGRHLSRKSEPNSCLQGKKELGYSNFAAGGQSPRAGQTEQGHLDKVRTEQDVSGNLAKLTSKNDSSIVALDDSELLMLHKRDVEQVTSKLSTDLLLQMFDSLGRHGRLFSRDLQENHSNLLPHVATCLEPCQFEATTFLFHAGSPASEVFLVCKGQCNLMLPATATENNAKKQEGPSQSAQVGTLKRNGDMVVSSILQAPCILGLQQKRISIANDSSRQSTRFVELGANVFFPGVMQATPQGKEQIAKLGPEKIRKVGHYDVSVQAASSVQAYALKLSAFDGCSPELKAHFFDKLAKLQVALANERDTVSTQTVSSRPEQQTPKRTTFRAHQFDSHTSIITDNLWPRNGASQDSTQSRLNCESYSKNSLLIAAVDLCGDFYHLLATGGCGVENKTYRDSRQCPHCLRLTYPQEQGVCDKCGFDCAGSWQPKPLKREMKEDALSTVDQLVLLRNRKRNVHHGENYHKTEDQRDDKPQFGTIHEHSNKPIATALSQERYTGKMPDENPDGMTVREQQPHEGQHLWCAHGRDSQHLEQRVSNELMSSMPQESIVPQICGSPMRMYPRSLTPASENSSRPVHMKLELSRSPSEDYLDDLESSQVDYNAVESCDDERNHFHSNVLDSYADEKSRYLLSQLSDSSLAHLSVSQNMSASVGRSSRTSKSNIEMKVGSASDAYNVSHRFGARRAVAKFDRPATSEPLRKDVYMTATQTLPIPRPERRGSNPTSRNRNYVPALRVRARSAARTGDHGDVSIPRGLEFLTDVRLKTPPATVQHNTSQPGSSPIFDTLAPRPHTSVEGVSPWKASFPTMLIKGIKSC